MNAPLGKVHVNHQDLIWAPRYLVPIGLRGFLHRQGRGVQDARTAAQGHHRQRRLSGQPTPYTLELVTFDAQSHKAGPAGDRTAERPAWQAI